MILADTSQGGYRRLAIVDDRLIGYLSVSTTQPDSLAIKHIIDEGHSIRDVTNPLLKGNFDARRYLTQKKSYAVKKWITGQLAAIPSAALNNAQPTLARTQPETDPVMPVFAPVQTDGLPSIRASAKHPIRPQEEQSAVYGEEPSPFTGNLPVVFGQKREITGSLFLKDNATSIPAEEEKSFVEDIGPFSGNLPAITGQIVESRRYSTTYQRTDERDLVKMRETRKLWAYAENKA
jgi:hypothetical protein